MKDMKIDPYNNKEKYLSWKDRIEQGIPNITEANSNIIKQYLSDMENGLNVDSTKKGSRSYLRLNTLRVRIGFLAREFEKRFNLTQITDIKEEQLFSFFVGMRNGKIVKKNGGTYNSVKDYVQDFKAFWHWWMRINRKKRIEILDITLDLDTSKEKPDWVYLTEEQIKLLCDNAKYDYKVLMLFLFDSGIRAPTELMNVKVSDLYNDCKELQIREGTSKTFGRKIKLMICSEILRDYIKNMNLKHEDYLFDICPHVVNNYLKRLATKIFGDKASPAGEKYSNLTMYDFRHCSCCYWLIRYKSESALKYRFGWKGSDKIHYYSELLGMEDTIKEEDLLMDLTKTEIEKRLSKTERDNELLKEDNNQIKEDNRILKEQMRQMLKYIAIAEGKIEIVEKIN
jgi:hypothetical protein